MHNFPVETYERELAQAVNRRRPLWVPEPHKPPHNHGIRIGDVGYITVNGTFIPLFNVRASSNHPINKLYGVPEGFETINVENFIYETPYYHSLNEVLTSSSISQRGLGGSLNQTLTQPGGGGFSLRYEFSKAEGAILHLPQGAVLRECTSPKLRVQAYKHRSSWWKFARVCGMKDDELFLVTTIVKTSKWMVGAFQSRMSGGEADIEIEATIVGAGLSYKYFWGNQLSYQHRIQGQGEQGTQETDELTPHGRLQSGVDDSRADAEESDMFNADAPGGWNHCIAFDGYKIRPTLGQRLRLLLV